MKSKTVIKVSGTTADNVLTPEIFEGRYILTIGRIPAKTIGCNKCFSGLD